MYSRPVRSTVHRNSRIRHVLPKHTLYILRVLSEEMTTRFRAAVRTHCSTSEGDQDEVRRAVASAAAEAHNGGISAEQFVIWVKRVWDEIMDEGTLANDPDPAHTREVVISSAIKAYYVQ